MELAPSITSCYAFSVRASTCTCRNFSPPLALSLFRYPIQQRRQLLAGANSLVLGSFLPLNGVTLRQSSIAAVTGDKTVIAGGSVNSEETDTRNGYESRDDSECLDEDRMFRRCDKLIEVFLVDKTTPAEWRRLLAFSRKWNIIGPYFYKRCQDRADSENDLEMKHKLLRLQRKLKEVDDDVQRHNELLEVIRRSPSEVGEIVARRRKDFTKEFFVHLYTVGSSYYDNPVERDAVTELGRTCLAAVHAYDTATESAESIKVAELKFKDIVTSPSFDVACKKIDDLAQKNQLDSALVLMMSKAWSAAKETNITRDEAKDMLFHLYMKARAYLERQMPKEIRILKYLLRIEDPEERMCALKDAFTPGEELELNDVVALYTTPEELYNLIGNVVDAYHSSKEGTLVREARELLSPKKVQKMEELRKLILDNFM